MTLRVAQLDVLLDESLCAYFPDLGLVAAAVDADWFAQRSLFPEFGRPRLIERLAEMVGVYGAHSAVVVAAGNATWLPERLGEVAREVWLVAASGEPPPGLRSVERLRIGGILFYADRRAHPLEGLTYGGFCSPDDLHPTFAALGPSLMLPWFAGAGSSRPPSDPDVRLLD